MLLHIISLMVIVLKSTRCSLVFDRMSQRYPQVQNYCPETKYCKEGTHVMCMYYDPTYQMGPGCYNFVNTKMTPKLVSRIVDIVNQIRTRVSSGDETGFKEEPFPKAYGMMRMSWDSELATFAQVLANQCFGGKEDICRSTEKFPSPSQGSAIVQFKYPNWGYLVNDTHQTDGLGEEKLEYAIERFFRAAYDLKRTVTRDMIVSCPDIHNLPNVKSRFYLNLIRGPATHIGCGISAYTRYNSHNPGKSSYYNAVEIICNFSEGPQPNQSIYMINPPIPGTGFTPNCGCPLLYQETTGCLCEENLITYDWTNPAQPQQWGQNGMQENTMIQQMVEQQNYMPNLQVGIGQPQPILNIPSPDLDPTVKLIAPKRVTEQPQWMDPNQMWRTLLSPLLLQKKATRQPFCNDPFGKCGKESVLLPIFSGHENYGSFNYLRSNNGSEIPLSRAQELAAITKFAENLIVEVPKISSEGQKLHNHPDIKNSTYLLSLLDNLEFAVKKIKFDTNTQEVFDSRMRSIYGNAQENYKSLKPTEITTESMNIDEQFDNVLKNYVKRKSDVESIRKSLGLNLTASAATMANEITEVNINNTKENLFEKLFVKNVNHKKKTRNFDADQQTTQNINLATENEALRTIEYGYKYGKKVQKSKAEPTSVVGNCINVKGQLVESKPFQDVQFPEDDLTLEDDNNKEVQFTLQIGNCVNVKGQLTKNERTVIEMVIGKDKNKDQWPENYSTLHKIENQGYRKNHSKPFRLRSTYFNDEDQFTEPTPLNKYSSKEKTPLKESLFQDGLLIPNYNTTADLRNNNYQIPNHEINDNLDQQNNYLSTNHKNEAQFKDNKPTPLKVDNDKEDKNHLKESSFQDSILVRYYNNTADLRNHKDQIRNKVSNHAVNDNLNHQNDNLRINHKYENQFKDNEPIPLKLDNDKRNKNHLKESSFQGGILIRYYNNTADQRNNSDQIHNKTSNHKVNDNLDHQNDNLGTNYKDENKLKDNEPTKAKSKVHENHLKELFFQNPIKLDNAKEDENHLKEFLPQNPLKLYNDKEDENHLKKFLNQNPLKSDNGKENENHLKDFLLNPLKIKNSKEDENHLKESLFQNPLKLNNGKDENHLREFLNQNPPKSDNGKENQNLLKDFLLNPLKLKNGKEDEKHLKEFSIQNLIKLDSGKENENHFKEFLFQNPHKLDNAKKDDNHKEPLFQDGILIRYYNKSADLRNNNDQLYNKVSNHDVHVNVVHQNDNLNKQKYLNLFQQKIEETTSRLKQTEETTSHFEQKIKETTPQFSKLPFVEKIISENKLRSSVLHKFDEMLAPSDNEEDVIVTRRNKRKNARSKFNNNLRSDSPQKSKKYFVIYIPTDVR